MFIVVGTTGIECEKLFTDQDFRRIKRLRKRAEEEKRLAEESKKGYQPTPDRKFNFLEEREKLKRMTHEIDRKFERKLDDDDDEGDDEGEEEDGDEEGEEEDENMEFGDEEVMDEEEIEDGDIEGEEEEDGDEEGEGEDGEEEGEEEEGEMDEEVVEKGRKKPEKVGKGRSRPNKNEFVADQNELDDDDDEINSSFFDESDSVDIDESRNTFLSASSIYNKDMIKRKTTRDQIKAQKAQNREEHLKLKVGHKIKNRGRLTNQQKKKNNPYQMFIQKKKLTSRLIDLKKAQKRIGKKLQKGHMRSGSRLGKGSGKKFN